MHIKKTKIIIQFLSLQKHHFLSLVRVFQKLSNKRFASLLFSAEKQLVRSLNDEKFSE